MRIKLFHPAIDLQKKTKCLSKIHTGKWIFKLVSKKTKTDLIQEDFLCSAVGLSRENLQTTSIRAANRTTAIKMGEALHSSITEQKGCTDTWYLWRYQY